MVTLLTCLAVASLWQGTCNAEHDLNVCETKGHRYRSYFPYRLAWLDPVLEKSPWTVQNFQSHDRGLVALGPLIRQRMAETFPRRSGYLEDSLMSLRTLLEILASDLQLAVPGFNISMLVFDPAVLADMQPCHIMLGLILAYLSGRAGTGLADAYAERILSVKWSSLVSSGWPVFNYLQDLLLTSASNHSARVEKRFEMDEICQYIFRTGDFQRQQHELRFAFFGALMTACQGAFHTNAQPFQMSMAQLDEAQESYTRTRANLGKDMREPEMAGAALSLLAVLEKAVDESVPGQVHCWGDGLSRLQCCGLTTDSCCGSGMQIAQRKCNERGIIHERCCKELHQDDCLQRFRLFLQHWARHGQPTCAHYRETMAFDFFKCATWTMPDHHFASEFAWPLIESGEGRCFEIEISLPPNTSNAYSGLGSKASRNEVCEVAGCPFARFGLCTPSTCSVKDVAEGWRTFLGADGDGKEHLAWCHWEHARVFEYRSKQETVLPWKLPVKHLHFDRSSGTTFKSIIHRLRSETFLRPSANLGGSIETRWSGSPYLCATTNRPPQCSLSSQEMLSFAVRDPLTRFVSIWHVRKAFSELGYVYDNFTFFESPEAVIHSLHQLQNVTAGWETLELYGYTSLAFGLGGFMNLLQCLDAGRIFFTVRSEEVNADAHSYFDLVFGSHNETLAPAMHFGLQKKAKTVVRELQEISRRAVRDLLVEDFFIIALLTWRGFVPEDYLEKLGLRAPQGPEKCEALRDDSGIAWLTELLDLEESWWIVWYDGQACYARALVNEALARAILGATSPSWSGRRTVSMELLGPRGQRLKREPEAEKLWCENHLQEVALTLCRASRARTVLYSP